MRCEMNKICTLVKNGATFVCVCVLFIIGFNFAFNVANELGFERAFAVMIHVSFDFGTIVGVCSSI